MATAYKILAQDNPSATTLTTLYTSTGVETVVSTITVANLAGSAATFRLLAQRSADVGSALNKQYLAYDVTVGALDTTTLTLGLTLASGDVLKIYASTATLAFNVFGSQFS